MSGLDVFFPNQHGVPGRSLFRTCLGCLWKGVEKPLDFATGRRDRPRGHLDHRALDVIGWAAELQEDAELPVFYTPGICKSLQVRKHDKQMALKMWQLWWFLKIGVPANWDKFGRIVHYKIF